MASLIIFPMAGVIIYAIVNLIIELIELIVIFGKNEKVKKGIVIGIFSIYVFFIVSYFIVNTQSVTILI